jgi:hypothetical protein
MPSNTSPSPKDNNELVRCLLWCYGVKRSEGKGFALDRVTSVLVGPKGIRLPLDARFLQELPVALLGRFLHEGQEVTEPLPGNYYQFEMPRWLADKKGFTING